MEDAKAPTSSITAIVWLVPGWMCVAGMAVTIPRLLILTVISFLFCDASGCEVNFERAGGALLAVAVMCAAVAYFLAVRRFGWLARAGAVAGAALCVWLWLTMGLAAFG